MFTHGNQAILLLLAHVPQLTTAFFLAPGGLFLHLLLLDFLLQNPLSKNKSRRGRREPCNLLQQVTARICFVCASYLLRKWPSNTTPHIAIFSHGPITQNHECASTLARNSPITHTPKMKEKETCLRKPVTLTLALHSQWRGWE